MVLVVKQAEADLVPGEGPRAELHDTRLLVKREVGHINCARGLENVMLVLQCVKEIKISLFS